MRLKLVQEGSAPRGASFQLAIVYLIRPGGDGYDGKLEAYATKDGAISCTNFNPTRWQSRRDQARLTQASEICAEVNSPGNRQRELRKEKVLCFTVGAEVWFSHCDGEFFPGESAGCSRRIPPLPGVPREIDLERFPSPEIVRPHLRPLHHAS